MWGTGERYRVLKDFNDVISCRREIEVKKWRDGVRLFSSGVGCEVLIGINAPGSRKPKNKMCLSLDSFT